MKSLSYFLNAANIRFRQSMAEWQDNKFKRKIVIFESDDWGAIRVPS